jgi:hypothetical protein
MRKEPERAPLPNIAKALAALLLTAALFQPGSARAGSHGGGEGHGGGGAHGAGGIHGGGLPGAGGGFHGGAFHGAPGGFHGGFAGFPHGGFHGGGFHPHGFPHGEFHAHEFHGERFHHHGFHGGTVLAPAFGGLFLGGGLGWPYYSYPDESYYGYGPYTQYWYCDNPEGYYPYVQQCNTGWQTVPAN